ncbi:MAG: ribonuclease III [Alphaproteobacteria bacterium]|nr:ribonuclease III [Alphaproteobacteria bacterium]
MSPTRAAPPLAHRFARPALLREALRHPSAAGPRRADYERLEFLGDRVLALVIAVELARRFPTARAGDLAPRLNALVRRDALARVARALALGSYVEVAETEAAAGGRDKPAILADACEALIGALYLDGGLDAASHFILTHWAALIEEVAVTPRDAKTALQEWAQGRALAPPRYRIVARSGPEHETVFSVAVDLGAQGSGTGVGRTRRQAEQAAAAALLDALAERSRP